MTFQLEKIGVPYTRFFQKYMTYLMQNPDHTYVLSYLRENWNMA